MEADEKKEKNRGEKEDEENPRTQLKRYLLPQRDILAIGEY